MYSEISSAVQFLGQFLYNKLPRRKVNLLLEQLANNLVRRLDSWNGADPLKGTDNRCIRVKVRGQVDPIISVTAMAVGLNIEEILQCFPDDLIIWIDPGEVIYRLGEKSLPVVLYSASEANGTMLSRLLSQNNALVNESSPSLRLSLPNNPSTPIHNSTINSVESHSTPHFEVSSMNDIPFTVGSFAMTRFGTTKVKNAPASINRLRKIQRSRMAENSFSPIKPPSVDNQSCSSCSSSSPPFFPSVSSDIATSLFGLPPIPRSSADIWGTGF